MACWSQDYVLLMGMERGRWQDWGIRPDFAGPQLHLVDALVKMGVKPTLSCTPYLFPGYVPRAAMPWPGPNPARWRSPTRSWAPAATGKAVPAHWRLRSSGGPLVTATIWTRTGRPTWSSRCGARCIGGRFRRVELRWQARPPATACPGSRTWRVAAAAAGRSDSGRSGRGPAENVGRRVGGLRRGGALPHRRLHAGGAATWDRH